MSTRSVLTTLFVFVALGALSPAFAQETAAAAGAGATDIAFASIFAAGFPLGIAAGLAAIGQGLSVGRATEALARNPSAAGAVNVFRTAGQASSPRQ